MQEFPINWFAILAAVIIKQAIGAFWCSPALFGPSWCKLAGVSEAEMKAGLVKALIPDVIGSALMAFVLVHAVHYAGGAQLGAGRSRRLFQLAWLCRRGDAWLGHVREAAAAALSDQQRVSASRIAHHGRSAGGLAVIKAEVAPVRNRYIARCGTVLSNSRSCCE
ncbi:MAG: DUF1761 domain-containing protein [Xanthobacteraceae bacterium]